nr:MAG TPA: hypothetical protein [Caudoviricetes sp.]
MNKDKGSVLAIILAMVLPCALVGVQAYILYVIVTTLLATGHTIIGWVVIGTVFTSLLLKGVDK